jgi:hypothetical protein
MRSEGVVNGRLGAIQLSSAARVYTHLRWDGPSSTGDKRVLIFGIWPRCLATAFITHLWDALLLEVN